MGRYDFVSPGAEGFGALQRELMQRAIAERQRQEDEFKRQQAEEQSQRQAAQLALQQQQEARIAQAQKATMDETARQHEATRAANIYQTQLPGVIDQSAVDLTKKYGYQLPVTQGPPTQGASLGVDENSVDRYDVIPGVLQTAGGFQYQQAQAQRESAKAIADANQAAATERNRESIAGREEVAALAKQNDVGMALDPSALDMTAKMYAKTGQLPPMGMGKQGATVRQAIINRAAQYDLATDTFGGGGAAPDLAGNKAGYSADTQSLNQLTKNMSAVSAFEETARKNSELLETVLKKIPGQNLPTFLNGPVRSIASALGSEDMAQFNALRQSVQNEYARIISQPTLAGTMSDSARHEMETIMSPTATVGQIRASLQSLQREAANRKQSFDDQIAAIKGRIKGGTTTNETAAPKRKYYDAKGNPVAR